MIRVRGEMEISAMGESSKITSKDSLLCVNFSHVMDYALILRIERLQIVLQFREDQQGTT